MPIVIQCLSCNKQATVPDSAEGKTVRCHCGSSFVVNARNNLVDEFGLAASALPANPVHAAASAKSPRPPPPPPPPPPRPIEDWPSVRPTPAAPTPIDTAQRERFPKSNVLAVLPKFVAAAFLALVGVGMLLAVFHKSESNIPSSAKLPTTPVPVWQDDEKLKEIAHKMYRSSNGIIDEGSGYKLARATIRIQGSERGMEILDSVREVVVGCKFSSNGKDLIDAMCAGDDAKLSGEFSVLQLVYDQSMTEIERHDCFDAAKSIRLDAAASVNPSLPNK